MEKVNGFIVAPFTPMHEDGSINLSMINPYCEMVVRNGMHGVFICGSSGEGALMTREERMAVAERWVEAAAGRIKVIVHTGCTSVAEQKMLAAHAAKIGAWGIGSMAPAFLPPRRVEDLAAYCAEVAAAAPELPFYYYHIPPLNGVNLSCAALLEIVKDTIPNFAGIKYTADDMYGACQAKLVAGGRFEILHGLDETFLSAMAYGLTDGGVGGTYNYIFPLYKGIKEAWEKGDFDTARSLQLTSQQCINVLPKYRGNIVCGKRIMKFLGVDCGPNRLPLQTITDQEEVEIKNYLDAINFSSFCNQ